MVETVNDRLIARFEELRERHDQLNELLADPAVASNPAKSITMVKEVGRFF